MSKKKLIEVALPLEAINKESAREKSIRHGHPSTLHLWWARRPLATCRAVLFASLVDDPSARPEEYPTEEAQEAERQRLFRLIEQLVKWENSNDEKLLAAARKEILKSTGDNPPPVYDPFCGGGSIPLEAQRLGLEAHGSDLNPVAVMITKALIEIPPKFAGQPPVNPAARKQFGRDAGWKGATGLAEDIRYYGQWMRDEAEKRIGRYYPKVALPREQSGGEATVIAWLWARTVKCPNPACGCEMPLVRSFALSKKKGKEAWVEPIVDKEKKTVRFEVRTGTGKPPEGTVNRRGAKCVCCGTAVPFDHVRSEGKAGRMGSRLMAIVAEGDRGRIYVDADDMQILVAKKAKPESAIADTWLPEKALSFRVQVYGMTKHKDLFTPRQLLALTTFSDLVGETRERVLQDAKAAGLKDDDTRLNDGGTGAAAYADAVATYLSFLVDQLANHQSSICSWNAPNEQMRSVYARQALPMAWDYAESNPFCSSSGSYFNMYERMIKGFVAIMPSAYGKSSQNDATKNLFSNNTMLISSDPPYYDNIGYADLSDFFYVWLRRSIGSIYPDIFSTMLVPKALELVATPYRFDGDRAKAQQFFETGLGQAFAAMHRQAHPDYPVTIYYAFKQSETDESEESEEDEGTPEAAVASTGWETMLNGLLQAGFAITGTWPVRSERGGRMLSIGTNALASSIVLVCRSRPADAPTVTRKEFLSALRRELPPALKELRQGNIAPVDLAQATIGPGMAVFSRYQAVLEASGEPMPVRTALQIINQELDAWLAHEEGEMDPDTRFCIAWYEQYGMNEAVFGEADVLARAKNTAVQRLEDEGLLLAAKGKVRLLSREELPESWLPTAAAPVWLCTQQLVRALSAGGETAAAELSARLDGSKVDAVKSLTYRLFAIADRKKWTEEALSFNALIASWSDVQQQAGEMVGRPKQQGELF
jgi:putative DNA methylase